MGKLLRYDFAILDKNNIVVGFIEFDDIQHEKFIPFFHVDEAGFKNCQERDRIKNDYSKKINVPMIRITKKYFNEIENILKDSVVSISQKGEMI